MSYYKKLKRDLLGAAAGMGELLFCYGGFPGLARAGYKPHLPAGFFGKSNMIQVPLT